MSSLLAAVARGAPKAAGVLAGSGVSVRATRIQSSLRAISSVSGLSQGTASSKVNKALNCAPLCPRALGAATSGRVETFLSHQRRSLSTSESESSGTDEATADDAAAAAAAAGDASAVEEAEESQHEGAEEPTPPASPAASDPSALNLLQIDGLPFDFNKDDLAQWFTNGGSTPTSITMPLRPESSRFAGSNKGRAFVEFGGEEDLEVALGLSGQSIGDRWTTITRLHIPIEEGRMVTVKGLKDVPEREILQMFEDEIGVAPTSLRIIENVTRNQGLVFAQFETPEQARQAICLDGVNVLSRWLDVSLDLKRRNNERIKMAHTPPFPDDAEGIVMAMKGLPFSLQDDEVSSFMFQYNVSEEDILEMNVPKHNQTTSNTGIAYLRVRDEEAAQKMLALKGAYIGERWIDVVRWARGTAENRTTHRANIDAARTTIPAALRKKHPDLPCVVISGLPFDKSRDEVLAFFAEQGVPESAVEEMQMPLFLQTQNNTGACWFVINEEEAYNRLMELNGAIIDDRWLTITDA